MQELPPTDVATRVEDYTRESNLAWVTIVLESQRETILARWLDAVAAQPFHHDHHDHAVADDIPRLFDAIVQFMQRAAPRTIDPGAPLDDPAIGAAAQGHALSRADQGLQPGDVLAELRIFRQELLHALRLAIPDSAPATDVVGAELLLNDAVDGAVALALSALTTRLEQIREEFFATTVHEIRQPITKIRGFTQLAERLLDRAEPDLEHVQSSLRHVEQATAQMEALLGNLVDLSRTALGGLVLQPGPTDLGELIPEIVGQMEPDVAERVTIEIAPDIPLTGHWDAGRLAQVLSNLLSNAAKYSPAGTPITIGVNGTPDTVVITVQDEGIGIPAEDLPRLFGRYVRAGNAIDGKTEGLGLGLYLSRGIVEAHGGRIWATSPGPGQGTTMGVELPRSFPGRSADA